jgi:hypothetical protein
LADIQLKISQWLPRTGRAKSAARCAETYFDHPDYPARVGISGFRWKRTVSGGECIILPAKVRARQSAPLTGATAEYVQTVSRLIDLLQLPNGWNSYNARPISRDNVTFAVNLLGRLMRKGTPVPNVVPRVRGGVQLEWHTKGINIEIDIDSPNKISFFAEEVGNDQNSFEEENLEAGERGLTTWIERLSV